MQKIKNGLLLISISMALLVFCRIIEFTTSGIVGMTVAIAIIIVFGLTGTAAVIVGGLGAFRLIVGLCAWLIAKFGKSRSPIVVEDAAAEAQAEGVWPPAPRP